MKHRTVPIGLYFVIFGTLAILTIATASVAYVDLGVFNTVIAMTIAVTKAVLVILYFMHVRYSSRLTWVFAGAGFCWLIIMISLTLSDFLSRGWVGATGGF